MGPYGTLWIPMAPYGFSGQPSLVVGDHAHSRGLELNEHCGPFQPRPFYDSIRVCHPKKRTVLTPWEAELGCEISSQRQSYV